MAAENARRFIDALHRLEEDGDVDTLAGMYAEGADISNPVVPHRYRGSEGAREFWRAYRGSFAEVHSDFVHVVEQDGSALLEWTSRGRGADGRDFSYRGVTVLEFDDDRISAFRSYFDPRHLGHQLAAGPRRAD